MPDPASITRSLNTLRTELEFLRDSGVVSPPQFQSIMAQLPQPGNAQPSPYVDPKFTQQGQPMFNPSQIAQQAQDPQNPAHPQNPKVDIPWAKEFKADSVQHHEWAKSLAAKFGNAAMWGAGATFGSDMVNDALNKF